MAGHFIRNTIETSIIDYNEKYKESQLTKISVNIILLKILKIIFLFY